MVTTALLRRKDFARHSSCLELTVHESSDITQVKGTLTGRASASLEEVKLDLSRLFQHNNRNKKLRKLFKALGDLPYLRTLRFHYASTTTLERLPVHLLTIALSEKTTGGGSKLEILELNHLNLTGTVAEFDDFLSILRSHPSLEVFSFSTSGCSSSSSINALLQALSATPKLEKVIIYSEKGRSPWGRLDGEAVKALCQSRTLKDLQHLVLYDSSESIGNFFGDEHTIGMSQALSSSPILTTTTTTINNLPPPPPPPQINMGSCLEEVMISCWPLGKPGIAALCQMIETNTSLRKLSMVVYELDEDNNTEETCSLPEIASALYHNSTLQVLELHGRNEIGKWMEEPFLNMMQSNYSLTTLELFHTDGLFLKPFLMFYLKLNRAGRGGVLQNENASRSHWVDSLIQVTNDISCLFYFISTNPLLCDCAMD